MTCALYRMYDGSGELLYVGISTNLDRRLGNHVAGKPWWPQVVQITVEHHRNRVLAEIAERNAIATEKPRWNIIHNLPGAKPHPPAFMELVKAWDEMQTERESTQPEQPSTPPRQREGDPQTCGYCGTGILGRPSAVRIQRKLTAVHEECRRQILAGERESAKQDRRNAREERKAAIMRGDIA